MPKLGGINSRDQQVIRQPDDADIRGSDPVNEQFVTPHNAQGRRRTRAFLEHSTAEGWAETSCLSP